MVRRRRTLTRLIGLACTLGLLSFSGLTAAQGKGVIHGTVSISYFDDQVTDVMVGRGVDVLLLKGDADLEAELEALKEKRLTQLQEQYQREAKARREFQQDRGADRVKKQEAWKQEEKKAEELRMGYNREVDALLARYVVHKTQTNQEGRFRFEGLPAGRYVVHARFQILRTHHRYAWLSAVTVPPEGGEEEIQLNKLSAINLYYGPWS